MKYNDISTQELLQQVDRVSSKIETIRTNIIKECETLDNLYQELVSIKDEIVNRTHK
jgi:hypothetical protein